VGSIACDGQGYVLTGEDVGDHRGRRTLETSMPGVFAAGDVRHGSVKRVASAVGEGAVAVKHVHEYLASSDSSREVAPFRADQPHAPSA
jgi:thioredoxin reductase (NADPH)